MRRTLTLACCVLAGIGYAFAQPPSPQITGAVNDFADIIDPASEAELERRIAALRAASGDTIVIVTVPSIEGFADIGEFKVKMFENAGRGIGEKGKDNGLLIAVAAAERKVGIEVGYDLEQFINDGFAGQIIRERVAPHFRDGRYGEGLVAGTTALMTRIADGRGVQLQDVPRETVPVQRRPRQGMPLSTIIFIIIIFILVSRGGRRGRRSRWGGPLGWSSGVGPFGGGVGGGYGGGFGGFGGGGFGGGGGGGFGGFGGGRSGGGGASGGW
ncbi:MAG: TPM domain-containing protein [Acidobacteria bacterium]|nr:TPM domain-containing protein [Acidobacteriota bacterium]